MDLFLNDSVLSEHKFWLQILGDYARFLSESLQNDENQANQSANDFIHLFDHLLEDLHVQSDGNTHLIIHEKAYDAAYRFYESNLSLLNLTLSKRSKTLLLPSSLNSNLDAIEEYLSIIPVLMQNKEPLEHSLHYHLIWLPILLIRVSNLQSSLDYGEHSSFSQTSNFINEFQILSSKSSLIRGYLRSGLRNFAALDRFNEQIMLLLTEFKEFISNLRDQCSDNKILGTMTPLMVDHVYRIACYYLQKLYITTDKNKKTDCDPSNPRIE